MAYSRRENLTFEGIPETFVTREEDGAVQRGEVSTENTKAVQLSSYSEFLESKMHRALNIDDYTEWVSRETKMEEKGSLLRAS